MPHICDLICVMLGYFLTVFSPRISHTLITLSSDPTAIYLELCEKAHVLRDDGFSLTFGLKLWSMSLFSGFQFQYFAQRQTKILIVKCVETRIDNWCDIG